MQQRKYRSAWFIPASSMPIWDTGTLPKIPRTLSCQILSLVVPSYTYSEYRDPVPKCGVANQPDKNPPHSFPSDPPRLQLHKYQREEWRSHLTRRSIFPLIIFIPSMTLTSPVSVVCAYRALFQADSGIANSLTGFLRNHFNVIR